MILGRSHLLFAPSVGHLHSLADDRGALGRCTGWSGSTTPAIATYTSPLLHCTRPTEVAPPPEGGFRLADNGLVKGVGTWHGRSPPGCTRPVSPRVGSRALGRSPRELFEGEWGPSVDVTLMVPTNLVMATRGWFERVRGAAHICRVPPTARRSPTTVPLAIRRLPQPASRAGWPAAVIVFCAPLGWARRSEWSLGTSSPRLSPGSTAQGGAGARWYHGALVSEVRVTLLGAGARARQRWAPCVRLSPS